MAQHRERKRKRSEREWVEFFEALSASYWQHCFRKYGLTKQDYIERWLRQDGNCALCFEPLLRSRDKPVIDHDHETGKVRGILHGTCNGGLGKLGDSIEGIRKALNYLEAHDAER